MDPSWTKCPYCEAADHSSAAPRPVRQDYAEMGKTKISSDEGAAGLAKTKIMPGYEPAGSAQSTRVAGSNVRIVGALVTYDWNKQGDMYPVTEGKTYIGAGKSRDGGLCDICVAMDEEMSREHVLILYRKGEGFTLFDRESANGTWMGNEMVREKKLGPTEKFRTGKTTWHFVSFESEKGAKPEPVSKPVQVIEKDVPL
jgi:hypothetical protein